MGFIIHGQNVEAPPGLIVHNFVEQPDEVYRFKNQPRPSPKVTELLIHETVTTSRQATVNVLKERGLGVHFIVDYDGHVYQHADLLDDEMWHGSQFNSLSIGIETVNPYEPQYNKPTIWTNVIDAPWAAGGKYVVPTPAEAEAVSQLTNWLTSAAANPITIPQLWPGLQGTHTMSMGVIAADKVQNPGIHAHKYFQHADGAWLVLYSWLRLEPGLSPDEAYAKAIALATGAHDIGVNLEEFFTANPYLTA